jgi:hypothetical protein
MYFVRDSNGGHCDGHRWWKYAGLQFRYQHLGFARGLEKKELPTPTHVKGWEL